VQQTLLHAMFIPDQPTKTALILQHTAAGVAAVAADLDNVLVGRFLAVVAAILRIAVAWQLQASCPHFLSSAISLSLL
jgi:hypothetical protein